MNKILLRTILSGLLLFFISSLPVKAQHTLRTPDLRSIMGGVFYPRSAGGDFRSTPDGEYYTTANDKHTAITRSAFSTGEVVETLFDITKARDCTFKSFDDYIIGPEGRYILLLTQVEPIYRRSYTADVYVYDTKRNLVAPLSEKGGRIMIPTFSEDGRMVAFVRDNNIFIKKFDFDTEVQVTTDGKRNEVINGATDWVYEEEFAQTNLMTWSPDGAFLAYVRTDESKVPTYEMPFYLNRLYPENYTYKYPVAGEVNSTVSLYVYNVADRAKKAVDVELPNDGYIPRISFTTKSDELAVITLNRRQNHIKLQYVNPRSLLPRLILEEKNDRYIDEMAYSSIQFLPDGFVFLSERDGWQHAYLYSNTGVQKRKITVGEYDVTDFYGVDTDGTVYYQSAEEGPARRSVYAINAKGRKTKLSQHIGTNEAIFSSNFKYYINTYSSAKATPRVELFATKKPNNALRALEDNAALDSRTSMFSLAEKQFMMLPTANGQELSAWIMKPVDFDESKEYPLLMVQYSGPNSQEVLDRYGIGWEQYLVSEGYIVACVDGRGTGARGEEFRKCTYLELGVRESEDQIAAAKALGELPYIDASRIGIWGWSYGGYNTLLSMCRGEGVFKVGIAVAPVTDWRFYDTIYTERFMRTPQENKAGYDKSAVKTYAKGLQGKLLIIHGSADDNVHVQNVMDFTEELVQKNLPFDMAIYTDKNHGIYGGMTRLHLYERKFRYLQENL